MPAARRASFARLAAALPKDDIDRIDEARKAFALERSRVRLFSHPLVVAKYFSYYIASHFQFLARFMRGNLGSLALVAFSGYAGYVSYHAEGPHQKAVQRLESLILWYGWWTLLGVMSSIGLGTGLHTFVLFLGPHLAQVTTVAYDCGHLNFAMRGPESFECRPHPEASLTIWRIAQKVKWEAFFWGFGTALGELPPYFVARAAAIAGKEDDEDGPEDAFAEIEDLERRPVKELGLYDRAKLVIMKLLKGYGFVGILICASIPNPLFDLAGILCGQFLIPFYTFFGATVIGKAIIKTSLQSLFIIALFSKGTTDFVLAFLHEHAPSLHSFAERLFHEQSQKFRHLNAPDVDDPAHIVSVIWRVVVTCMLGYFLVSIVESLAIAEMRSEHRTKVRELSDELLDRRAAAAKKAIDDS
ncbi:transmembrane protein 49, isoform CRA_a [Hyaloraphidium curvatum]|nr:transmembrane protein 49, isoform CRA_a [Hyaloraphidium curvatum]